MLMWQFDDDKLKAMLLLIFLIGLNTGLFILDLASKSWSAVVLNVLSILVLLLPVVGIVYGE